MIVALAPVAMIAMSLFQHDEELPYSGPGDHSLSDPRRTKEDENGR